jgi:gas vesicle structural protein
MAVPSVSTVPPRPAAGTLYDVIDVILDKGLVIDAYVRVALVGVELLTVDVRVVIASVDTYLHFAEATNRLDLRAKGEEADEDIGDLITGMSEQKTEGAIEGGMDKIREAFGRGEEEKEEAEEEEEER